MKKILYLMMLLFLGACTHQNPLSDFRFQAVPASPYVVASWHRITEPGEPLKIYIEGDGHAFDNAGRPTDNPTPQSTFWRDVAAGDPSPNVAYIGRPCQYLQAGACSERDWTSGRFSAEIIDSMDKVIRGLQKKARADQVILIGYSGGAQVAGLTAVRQPETVARVITVAGVLDPAAWAAYHGDAPLHESLNLRDERAVFQTIPQHHYVGGRDTVVPAVLTQEFIGDDDLITVVPNATHSKGWNGITDEIYKVRK